MNFSEKLKLIRKTNNITQAQLAKTIGISRSNLANIEIGNVAPTPLFVNCISLMYNIDKSWLLNDNNNDLSVLNESTNMLSLIKENYDQLEDKYKKFVEKQIILLLEIQNSK